MGPLAGCSGIDSEGACPGVTGGSRGTHAQYPRGVTSHIQIEERPHRRTDEGASRTVKEFDVIETSNDLMSAEDARRLLRFMDREDASRWTASEKMLYVYAHTVVVQAEQIAALRTALVEVERRGAVGYRRPASSHDPRCDAARNYEAPCSCPDSL